MFVTSVNILKETGGNLAETFETIVLTIRERLKIEKKIESMTAQGRSQGYILMFVTPVLGFVFFQTDPELMMPLFNTFYGWLILAAVITLQCVAFIVIMKIVKIEV
jgi:tight adherence protein B